MMVEAAAGFAVGLLAYYIVPDSPGAGADTLTGLVGGGVAAFIFKLFGHTLAFDDFSVWSITSAAAGALFSIILLRATAGRQTIA